MKVLCKFRKVAEGCEGLRKNLNVLDGNKCH